MDRDAESVGFKSHADFLEWQRSGVVDTPDHAELAGCLRGAVTAMEALVGLAGSQGLLSTFPGLPGLIERSKAALKEYDK